MRILLILLFLSTAMSGCALVDGSANRDALDLAELKAAPKIVRIGSQDLRLTTILWRDFMPISPPDGKPLRAVFTVQSSDSTTLPEKLQLTEGWVVFGEDVWSTVLEPDSDCCLHTAGWVRRATATDGPKWGPGVLVETVVRITAPDGTRYLLRSEQQTIERTD